PRDVAGPGVGRSEGARGDAGDRARRGASRRARVDDRAVGGAAARSRGAAAGGARAGCGGASDLRFGMARALRGAGTHRRAALDRRRGTPPGGAPRSADYAAVSSRANQPARSRIALVKRAVNSGTTPFPTDGRPTTA